MVGGKRIELFYWAYETRKFSRTCNLTYRDNALFV